jgi:hypothetical protein
MIRRSRMMLERRHKLALCHRDRWRVGEMLRSQPDLREIDPVRDLDLWRHLFDPDDLVLIGEKATAAAHAPVAEYCWGNVWRDGLPIGTVAYCLSAVDLLRGASHSERMSRRQSCEAVLGRLRSAGSLSHQFEIATNSKSSSQGTRVPGSAQSTRCIFPVLAFVPPGQRPRETSSR